jgi:hypothetical protein
MATQLNGLLDANHIDDIIIKEVGVRLVSLETDIYSIFCSQQIKYSELNLPLLTGITQDIYVAKNSGLQWVNIPQLPAYNSIYLIENSELTGVTQSNWLNTINGVITIEANPLLESFSARFVTGNTTSVKITDNNSITFVNLSSLSACGPINISSNSSLTDIFISPTIESLTINLVNNALTEATVDSVLLNVDTAGYSGGTLTLSGGINSAPSVSGLLNKSSLITKGWSVSTN